MKTPDEKGQANEGRRRVALAALIAGLSRPAAASAAGVSERTLDRWKAEPGFAADLDAGRHAAFSDALAGLKGAAGRAVETLAGLLNSRNETTRRQAAESILGFALKAHDTQEIDARLTALEKRADEYGHRTGGKYLS